mgnify:CR=1 FL=1
MNEKSVYKKINSKRNFAWIKRKVSPAEIARLRRDSPSGVNFISEDRYLSILLIVLIMTKIREPLSIEQVLSNVIQKLDENDITRYADKYGRTSEDKDN